MVRQWTVISRLRTLRTYTLSNDTLTVICQGVFSYAFSFEGDRVVSVDPTGGPYFKIGSIVSYQDDKWVIQRIVSHHKKKGSAVFVFDVK